MSKPKFEAKVVAEVAVFAALSAALYSIRPFSLPYGGSITLGSMVPVFWISLRRGVRVGLFTGMVFGIVALPIDVTLLPYSPIVHPVQVLLDYPVAFGLLGLTGLFKARPLVGVGVSTFCRFLSHFISGVVYWPAFTPEGWNPVAWSIAYNGSFLLPEFVISAILIFIIIRRGILKIYM